VRGFVPPRRRWLPAHGGARPGYVNWGVYLTDGEVSGLCSRLQPTPLTDEATAWWAPPALRSERPARPRILEPRSDALKGGGPGPAWREIAHRPAPPGDTDLGAPGPAHLHPRPHPLPPAR